MAYDFKKEEDVQEYLQNIGTEYRFSCFKEKNAEGCHLLGDYLEAIKRDFEGAAKVYQANCEERNYAKSCSKYGNFCCLGQGVEKNLSTALKYYRKSCTLDSPDGCLFAGVLLTGKEAKENNLTDNVEGLKYLEKACSMGNPQACFFASGLYLKGVEGIPRNRKKASELALPACNGRIIFACMNLSQMYRVGDGVEKDEKKAEEFKERARDIRDDMRQKRPITVQNVS